MKYSGLIEDICLEQLEKSELMIDIDILSTAMTLSFEYNNEFTP